MQQVYLTVSVYLSSYFQRLLINVVSLLLKKSDSMGEEDW
jgi:hypothetical protein